MPRYRKLVVCATKKRGNYKKNLIKQQKTLNIINYFIIYPSKLPATKIADQTTRFYVGNKHTKQAIKPPFCFQKGGFITIQKILFAVTHKAKQHNKQVNKV